MRITKRSGKTEPVRFDKIVSRIKKQTYGLSLSVDAHEIAKTTINGVYDGISSKKVDELAAETAAMFVSTHPDYAVLAARIAISALHKDTPKLFSEVTEILYNYVDPHSNKRAPIISKELYDIVQLHKEEIDGYIVNDRDFNYDFFGYKTLEKSYLLKNSNRDIIERPQHMLMRVSLGIWKDNLEQAFITYDLMSQGLFTHATPTLYNSGTNKPQLSSCFLLTMKDDSLKGIYNTLTDISSISALAGGIGVSVHGIRATGSYIRGTNGVSNGIIPMLRVFNETAKYVDQCFVGSTEVSTLQGIKTMEEITEGDLVLTSDNVFNKVVKKTVFDKQSRPAVKIITEKGENTVTPSHSFLVIKNVSHLSDEQIKNKLHSKQLFPIWVDANTLTSSDVILKNL